MSDEIKDYKSVNPHTQWRHFEGGIYTALGTASDSETMEPMVVYRSDDGRMFVRPLSMWREEVDRPEIPYSGPRFVQI